MSAAATTVHPARAPSASPRQPPGWWQFLRRELAPAPGRSTRTSEAVLTVVLVTLVSMTLRVPEASLSCYLALIMIKDNRVATLLTCVLIGLAFAAGIIMTLLVYRYTFDYPELRIPFMMVSTFTGMYLSRVIVIGPVAFIAGFVLSISQSVADGVPTADTLVRAMLWLGVVLCCPALVVYVVGEILLPIDPKDALIDGISERLDGALAALRAADRHETPDRRQGRDLLDRATSGSARLLKLLGLVEKEDKHWKGRHNELAAAITASEQVSASAAALQLAAGRELSDEDRQRARALRTEVLRLKNCVRRHERPARRPAAPGTRADSNRLRELQLALAALRDSLAGESFAAPAAPPKKKPPFFKPDSLTNPVYVRFALKVTLAAMTCYVLYTAFDWPGTQTAFVTCCFIALETAGATMHKGTLRIIGCLSGALTGFLCVVFLIPHMTGITSFLLLSACGAAVAGWISASESIGYGGLQFGYAFFICIYQSYGPDVNFDPIRDRIIGILLGLTVSTAIYQYVWPDRATDKLREVFARALRSIAELLARSPDEEIPAAGANRLGELYDSIINDLGTTQELLGTAAFEDQDERMASTLASARPKQMVRHAQAVCLIAGGLLGKTGQEEWRDLEAAQRDVDTARRDDAARQLRRAADCVASGKRLAFPNEADARETAADQAGDNDRSRLLQRLQEECALLTANCRPAGAGRR